jgi:hypothetical protein
MTGAPRISTNLTAKISDGSAKDRQMLESLQHGFDSMNEHSLRHLRKPGDMLPHCDCEELNRASGLVRTMMNDRATCSDDAWVMMPTELNAKGNCKHCNYVPVYKERDDV